MHLPARATAAAVHDARVRVLRGVIAGADRADALPSDVPAGLRLAFDERLAARDAYADLARDFGPKHPELIAARVRLDDATRALPLARDAALHELDAPPPRAVDISRRAELAARARALRAAYEAALESLTSRSTRRSCASRRRRCRSRRARRACSRRSAVADAEVLEVLADRVRAALDRARGCTPRCRADRRARPARAACP